MPELDIVRSVDPTEVETNHKPDQDEPGTVICGVCGDDFTTQRGLNVHIGHTHPDRADLQVKTGRTRTGTRRPRKSDFIESTDDKIAKYRQFIGNDVNNWLLLGASTPFVGISPLTFAMRPPALGGDTVADKIKFSKMETEILAQGIARLDGTPLATTLVSTLSGAAPYALGLGMILVVLLHSYSIWRLRSDLPSILEQKIEKDGAPSGKPSDAAPVANKQPTPKFQAI